MKLTERRRWLFWLLAVICMGIGAYHEARAEKPNDLCCLHDVSGSACARCADIGILSSIPGEQMRENVGDAWVPAHTLPDKYDRVAKEEPCTIYTDPGELTRHMSPCPAHGTTPSTVYGDSRGHTWVSPDPSALPPINGTIDYIVNPHVDMPVSTEPDGYTVVPDVTETKGSACYISESYCLNHHAECFQGKADPGWTPGWSSIPDTVCATRNNSDWTTWGHSKERGMYAAHEEPQRDCEGFHKLEFGAGALLGCFITLLFIWRRDE